MDHCYAYMFSPSPKVIGLQLFLFLFFFIWLSHVIGQTLIIEHNGRQYDISDTLRGYVTKRSCVRASFSPTPLLFFIYPFLFYRVYANVSQLILVFFLLFFSQIE